MTLRHRLAPLAVGLVFLTGCSRAAQAPPASQSPAAQTPAPAPSPTQQPAPATRGATPAGSAVVSFSDIKGLSSEQAITDMAALGTFDATTGEFKPAAPITRAEFIRWLVKANNVYYKDAPAQQIHLAESNQATFVDVPPTHPDFKYIQGMANAGYVIGIDATHFGPDQSLTREQMIAVKVSRDEGGETVNPLSDYEIQHGIGLSFSDRQKITKIFTGYVHEDDSVRTSHNIGRVWGSIKTLNPQAPVTRAEAAVCLSVFGGTIPEASAAKAVGRTK